MHSEGYSAIVVGVDDGHWEGEAVKDGRIVGFHADGKSGKKNYQTRAKDRRLAALTTGITKVSGIITGHS